MGLDASSMLGSQQLAGLRVNNRGYYFATMARGGGKSYGGFAGGAATGASGIIGSTLMARWARKKGQAVAADTPPSSTPPFTHMAYLVVTATDLALIAVDAKKVARLTTVLAQVPRSQVSSVTLDDAGPLVSKPLTVNFMNGEVWTLEVSAALKRPAKKLVKTFEAPAERVV